MNESDWLDHYNQVIDYKSPANTPVICDQLLQLFKIPQDTELTVVDLGCGTGFWCHKISLHTGGHVLGVDFAINRILEARNRYGKDAHFVCMDIHQFLNKAPAQCHTISMFEVLEHMADPVTAVFKAKELLADGGKFIGSVPINSHYKTHLQIFNSVADVETKLSVKVVRQLDKWAFFEWVKD